MSYPSENQQEGLQFLIDSINNNEKVIVLSGQGGSGKTTLAKDLSHHIDRKLHFSASTNKAASRLSESINKGLSKDEEIEVKTMHQRVCTPVFTAQYLDLVNFYDELKKDKEVVKRFKQDFFKAYMLVTKYGFDIANLEEYSSANELLATLKVDTFGKECFVKYQLKTEGENAQDVGDAILIVDEASMLPSKSIFTNDGDLLKVIGLDSAMEVYSQIILLGDINQLPPIQGESSFDDLPTFELTENFRANDHLKGIISHVLSGGDPALYKPTEDESDFIYIHTHLKQEWYDRCNKRKDVVNICYTNNTRKTLTKRIRGNDGTPKEGDIVYYNGFNNTHNIKGDIGVVNSNLHFEYEVEEGQEPNIVVDTVRYFDEYAPENGWSFMRYGYAITGHMSQGSEWDHIIVHASDIPRFVRGEDKRKWLYTAVSRARKTLTIVG